MLIYFFVWYYGLAIHFGYDVTRLQTSPKKYQQPSPWVNEIKFVNIMFSCYWAITQKGNQHFCTGDHQTINKWPKSKLLKWRKNAQIWQVFTFLVFSASMTHLYLRNTKHVLRFYQVIETGVKVWENEKCSEGRCFHSYLEFSQTFTSVSLTQLATQRTCFLFLLENTAIQKRSSSKCQFSLLAPSLCQQLMLALWFYQVIETRF